MSDLNAQLKSAAESMVGKDAVTSRYGRDCFALVDKLLRGLGAQTAADGDVRVTANADYDWGDGLMLDSIEPGDILQFKKHVIHIQTYTRADGTWYETDERWLSRGHHTAIVMAVGDDGSVTVVEQNVHPNPEKVKRNVIPQLDSGEFTKRVGDDKKIKMTVTGEVHAYRPAPKASASHYSPRAGATRTAASFMPLQGGMKRRPGVENGIRTG